MPSFNLQERNDNMIEAYSSNITVTANQAIPFNNLVLKKGCTVALITPTTIQFNKCGIYCVACDVSAGTSSTITLYKDGVAQPWTSSEGVTPHIYTYVVVEKNADNNPCTLPTNIQIMDDTAGTLTNASIKVSKMC